MVLSCSDSAISPALDAAPPDASCGDGINCATWIKDYQRAQQRDDHAAFIGSGFSSVGVSEEFVSGDFNPHYHTAEDSYENVDFDYLERISGFAFEVTARAQ